MLLVPGLILLVWGTWGSIRQIQRLYRGFNLVTKEGTCPDGWKTR
jgi:hypothetical protein